MFCSFDMPLCPHTFSLQGFSHYVLSRACLLESLTSGLALSGTFIIGSHHGYLQHAQWIYALLVKDRVWHCCIISFFFMT